MYYCMYRYFSIYTVCT